MSITPEKKSDLIRDYRINENDTGSPQVQIAVLSERILNLTEHFKTHKKDNHSRQSMFKMVNRRRCLLGYIRRKDEAEYKRIIGRLGLRR